MKNFILFCDGGSRGNPGPAASGFVVYSHLENIVNKGFTKEIMSQIILEIEGGQHLGNTTNNVAEWQAVVLGLKKIIEKFGTDINLSVFLDSELVVRQITGVYKVKHSNLIPYFLEVSELAKSFTKISFNHVYRADNKAADAVVNRILDEV